MREMMDRSSIYSLIYLVEYKGWMEVIFFIIWYRRNEKNDGWYLYTVLLNYQLIKSIITIINL